MDTFVRRVAVCGTKARRRLDGGAHVVETVRRFAGEVLSHGTAAQPDLVSIDIAIRDLAHAIGIGFLFHGGDSPISDLRDERIEAIDEKRVHGVSGVFRLLDNVHVPMLRKLPDGLCVVWKECGRGS